MPPNLRHSVPQPRVREIFPDIEDVKLGGGDPEWLQSDETPRDPDGKLMTFIAQIDSGDFLEDDCDTVIYLFHSAEHQLAVQVYQIT